MKFRLAVTGESKFPHFSPNLWMRTNQAHLSHSVGAFDWTTTDPANAYVDSSGLRIVPTLTNETTTLTNTQIEQGYTLNLTLDGTCTGIGARNCVAKSNTTTGRIINPIRSARLSTKGKKSIRYGRVEVTAKLPRGDWIWPAIWMMPEKDTYGVWPRSGEIDIMEARGNDMSYEYGGRDEFSSSLHWGEKCLHTVYPSG